MKALVLVVLLALVCVVLFGTGLFSPARSRRLQHGVNRLSKKGKVKGDRNAGRLGDLTRDALEKMRSAADTSAEKGREFHGRVID